MRVRRKALKRQHPDAGRQLADRLAAHLADRPGLIGGYWPIGSELDLRPTFARLADRDWALPRVPDRAGPLSFHRWAPGTALEPGAFATFAPAASPPCQPQILLIPLLAFDRRGGRLGQGGGWYDRTLAALGAAVYALGIAYAGQEVPAVPVEPHDRPLDAIFTEQGLIGRENPS